MAHPYHQHREHQVAHRRVAISLKDHPPGAQALNTGSAFSAVTSKSAASDHDADDGPSRSAPKRFARGGKVKKAEGGGLDSDNSGFMSKSITDSAGAKISGKLRNPFSYGRIKDRPPVQISGPTPAPTNNYARGGKVKHGHQTNIAIVVPHRGAQQPMAGAPPVMAGAPMPGGPPMAGPPPGPGAGNPPGLPQGMPMHKRGGRVKKAEGGSTPVPPSPFTDKPTPPQGNFADIIRSNPKLLKILQKNAGNAKGGAVCKAGGGSLSGEATKGNIEKWSKRASGNSYFRGGAATGVGREEKAASQKKRK